MGNEQSYGASGLENLETTDVVQVKRLRPNIVNPTKVKEQREPMTVRNLALQLNHLESYKRLRNYFKLNYEL
jgi:hypothetical protein